MQRHCTTNAISAKKKDQNRRKRQQPVDNCEESFIHVGGQTGREYNRLSIRGNDLRNIRRLAEQEESESSGTLFASAISVAAMASAGFSAISRFSSRSTARRRKSVTFSSPRNVRTSSSPTHSPVSVPPPNPPPITEGRERVKSLGFRFSSSQLS